ncbi:hypothetical protein HNP46_000199 [Pseudomonas nitritireducens]|uniref:Uncharacterized protein n=1 Tax=Pseudomonas nitroreducens TaxID=46680 RepID=A0A7W7KFL6_PSENT|nr:hypothetical protein [Pseudomonas nitritireducens]MBB4861388.1 hypothetical protein [Pseudomonas nitritireducens]
MFANPAKPIDIFMAIKVANKDASYKSASAKKKELWRCINGLNAYFTTHCRGQTRENSMSRQALIRELNG